MTRAEGSLIYDAKGDVVGSRLIAQNIADYRAENGLSNNMAVPADAVTASASGLDPHISIANAYTQGVHLDTPPGSGRFWDFARDRIFTPVRSLFSETTASGRGCRAMPLHYCRPTVCPPIYEGLPKPRALHGVVYSLLFEPPLESPIDVGLDLPIGGRGYSTESIGLVIGFVKLTIQPPKKRTKSRKKQPKEEEKPPVIDGDGSATLDLLGSIKNLATRMAGKSLRSLALHPAVYFYSATGRFQPTAFLATASLFKELEDRERQDNKPAFQQFTLWRKSFEAFLIRHRYLVNQTVIKFGSMEKGHEPLLDMFRTIFGLVAEGKSDSEVMQGLKEKFAYLRKEDARDFPVTDADFQIGIKNAKIRKEGIRRFHRCNLCGAAINPNAISMGHDEDKKDGGIGSLDNLTFEHPFCNGAKDALIPLFSAKNSQYKLPKES